LRNSLPKEALVAASKEKGFEMGRLVLFVLALGVGFGVLNNGFTMPDGLEGKLHLVALFPAVYLLGWALLGD
jgi:hypothetical protein